MAGADEHDVAGLDVDAAAVEVGRRDLVAGLEPVDAFGPGDVQQHAAADQDADAVDAAVVGAAFVDVLERKAVPQPAVVGDVRQRVPVCRRLQAHHHHVVAEAHLGGVAGEGGLDRDHRPQRVDASRYSAELRTVVVERETEGEAFAVSNGGGGADARHRR